jgi:hypothetical protein
MIYKASAVAADPNLGITRGGFILIGLLSGGDYHPAGLARCGPKIALGLARAGLGDRLLEKVQTCTAEDMPAFLDTWREDLRTELRTNASGYLGKKCVALSKTVPDDFPDPIVLRSYTHPITTESEAERKGTRPKDIKWGGEPSISAIAGVCELYFEWGVRDVIIKRFRTVVWPAAVLRILRQIVTAKDASGATTKQPPTLHADDGVAQDGDSLFTRIHSSRTHPLTGNLLEYRLEVAPSVLVALAASGVKGTRPPVEIDSAYELTEEENDEECRKGKKTPTEPDAPLRIWVPACMLEAACPDLVRLFDDRETEKASKKAGIRKPRSRAGSATPSAPPSPKKRKPKTFPGIPSIQDAASSSSSSESVPLPLRKNVRASSLQPSGSGRPPAPSSSQSSTTRVAALFAVPARSRPRSIILEEEEENTDEASRPVPPPVTLPQPPPNAIAGPSTPSRSRGLSRTHSSPAAFAPSSSVHDPPTLEVPTIPDDLSWKAKPKPKPKPKPFPGLPSPISKTQHTAFDGDDSDFELAPPPPRANVNATARPTMPSFFTTRKPGAPANASKRVGKNPITSSSLNTTGMGASTTASRPSIRPQAKAQAKLNSEYIELSDTDDEDEFRSAPAVPTRGTSKPPLLRTAASAPAPAEVLRQTNHVAQPTLCGWLDKDEEQPTNLPTIFGSGSRSALTRPPPTEDDFAMYFSDDNANNVRPPRLQIVPVSRTSRRDDIFGQPPSPMDRHMRSPSISPTRDEILLPPESAAHAPLDPLSSEDISVPLISDSRLAFTPPPRPTRPRASGTSSIIDVSSSEEEMSPTSRAKLTAAQRVLTRKIFDAPQKKLHGWVNPTAGAREASSEAATIAKSSHRIVNGKNGNQTRVAVQKSRGLKVADANRRTGDIIDLT